MGVLKHVLIPFYALLHLIGFYQALDPSGFVQFCGLPLEAEETQTTREIHLVGVIMSFHLAMAFLCVAGFVMESSHFRGLVMVWEVVFYGLRTINAIQLGLDFKSVTSKPGIAAGVAIIGVILHAMEPGLFTEDKNKKEAKRS